MKLARMGKALPGVALALLLCHGAGYAEDTPRKTAANPVNSPPAPSASIPALSPTPNAPVEHPGCADDVSGECQDGEPGGSFLDRLYGGGDYLFVRTAFSEAVAFVRTTNIPTANGLFHEVDASELNFDYKSSFRAFLGCQLDATTGVQLTYWHLDTAVDVNGQVGLPNQTIVDPFGNTAGPGGADLTRATVRLNVYDMDLDKTMPFENWNLDVGLKGGVRIADLDQTYTSQILTAAGGPGNHGDFSQTFTGAGPHVGLDGNVWLGEHRRLSLYAKTEAALLLGDLQISSDAFLPGLTARQSASRTRVIPVLGTELGVEWRPTSHLSASAGWMFEDWFDVGTSGGTFGGNFQEDINSNIMSFNGLTVRVKLSF